MVKVQPGHANAPASVNSRPYHAGAWGSSACLASKALAGSAGFEMTESAQRVRLHRTAKKLLADQFAKSGAASRAIGLDDPAHTHL